MFINFMRGIANVHYISIRAHKPRIHKFKVLFGILMKSIKGYQAYSRTYSDEEAARAAQAWLEAKGFDVTCSRWEDSFDWGPPTYNVTVGW